MGPWEPRDIGPEVTLDCTLVRQELANVVTVHGEIDLSNVHSLEETCTQALSSSLPLIVDLDAVPYIDSTGLNVLMKIRERCQTRRVEFAVAFTSMLLSRIFSVLSLQETLRIFPTVGAAMDALSRESS